MANDESFANLIITIGKQYHDQINDKTFSNNKTRLEIVRKLELIKQSIKGLMGHTQLTFKIINNGTISRGRQLLHARLIPRVCSMNYY